MEVKIKGVKQLEASLLKVLKEIETDKEILNAVGEKSKQLIVGFTKAGASDYKTAPVSKSTMLARKELAKFNDTDPAYRKNKSLTFTGQLLNSLTYAVKDSLITLFFAGDHKPYLGKNGPIGKAQPNSEIARKVQRARPFLFLSDGIKKQLETILVRETRRKIALYQALLKRVGKK